MAHTTIFNLAVISVVFFGILTANAQTEFDEEEDTSYSDHEEDLEGQRQFEDNVSLHLSNEISKGFIISKFCFFKLAI